MPTMASRILVVGNSLHGNRLLRNDLAGVKFAWLSLMGVQQGVTLNPTLRMSSWILKDIRGAHSLFVDVAPRPHSQTLNSRSRSS